VRARQRNLLLGLGLVLIAGGALEILLARRLPLPLRLEAAAVDFVAAAAVLLFRYQNKG
jgi:hypothetical protein